MKTVRILESFDGYPAGRKVSFAEGAVETVSDAFAELIVAKGHARLDSPPAKPQGRQPATPKDAADEAE